MKAYLLAMTLGVGIGIGMVETIYGMRGLERARRLTQGENGHRRFAWAQVHSSSLLV
ncbi:MAG: hypothetical protein ABI563_18775 [Specibacter sp.]